VNLDRKLICGLLQPDDEFSDADKVRLLLATGHAFAQGNLAVLNMIIDHAREFGRAPVPETINEHHPGFVITHNAEPYRYYLNEAVRLRQAVHVRDAISRVERALAEDRLEQAVTEYAQSARNFEILDLKSRDLDVARDIEAHAAEYRRRRDTGDAMGISTGFPTLDQHTFGIHPGEFWLFIGRPGAFKTWLLCQMFCAFIRNLEGPVLFFSKEMTREQILLRTLAILGRDSFTELRRHQYGDERLEAVLAQVRSLKARPIIIGRDPRWNYDIGYFQSKVLEYKPRVACLDGAYLFAKSAEWTDVTNFTRSLRDVALMSEVPVVATTQQKPKGGGAMYADSFEQDASVLIRVERGYDDVLERRTQAVTLNQVKIRDEEDGRKVSIYIDFERSVFLEGVAPAGGDDWQSQAMN